MSVYGELDPMIEHKTQFVFKGKRKHIATFNTPNIAYPDENFKIIIPQGSAGHAFILLKLRFISSLHQQTRPVLV